MFADYLIAVTLSYHLWGCWDYFILFPGLGQVGSKIFGPDVPSKLVSLAAGIVSCGQVLSGEITLKVSVISVDELLKLLPESCSLLQLRLRWPVPGAPKMGMMAVHCCMGSRSKLFYYLIS